MTTVALVEEMAEELKNITKDLYFEDAEKNQVTMKTYEFALPYQKYEEEEEPFPYIVIAPNTGCASEEAQKNTVSINLYIGIRKEEPKNDGKRDVLGVMQRITERFRKNNMLKCFRQVGDITWAVDDEDAYPYYFGGMSMTFQVFKIEREESEYA